MAAAAGCQQQHTDGDEQNTAWLDKITQSHKRFLTMGVQWVGPESAAVYPMLRS
jgi:hypothetical protein